MSQKNKLKIAAALLLMSCLAASAGPPEKQKSAAPSVPRLKVRPETAPDEESKTEGSAPTPVRSDRRYILRGGDIVELNFPFTAEFNQIATVQPDGYLTLRGVGEVFVGGRSIAEVRQIVQAAYAKIVATQTITVELKEFEKPYFIVGGEVGHPGKYDLRGDTTAAQAIAIAGGLRESAKHSEVLLFRRASHDWLEAKKLDLRKMLRAGNLGEDPRLQNGDMLFVPKNAISKLKPFIPVPGLGAYFSPGQF